MSAVPLPVDVFLVEMVNRVNAPRILFKPISLKNLLRTEELTAYVYWGIEKAFTEAGMVAGGNRLGHVGELKNLGSGLTSRKPAQIDLHQSFLPRTRLCYF